MKVKGIIALFLVMFTLTSMLWKSFAIIHFYSFQEQIEAEHCVNKDKPQLNCHGKCHLQEILQADRPEETEPKVLQNSIPVFLFSFLAPSEQSGLFHLSHSPSGISFNESNLSNGFMNTFVPPPETHL